MPIARRRLLVAAAGVTAVVLSGCDAASTAPAPNNPRQVTVVGNGQVKGVPDTLTADVSIEASAPDVTTATNQTNDRQKSVLNALNASGIDAKDISTTGVSLQPQYGTDGSTISGYRASNSIQITIRKLDTASQVLANVISAGGDATRINSVSYSIEDDSKLVSDARARAFNDAKERAAQYAELSGLSLGKILLISESPGSEPPPPPTPMPRGAMASDVPLQPGEQTVGFSVTAVWELD
ncbi:SIMPL domain-containing protein [Mycobacterium sp. M26]|uniref:SIMPL domain-containing protein n=1 Tax=Mycobacterium sp. M26 TaxID=1762962 RepID=UPI00073F7A83|nr:SIMPL domain-containing protein [Mycobacterium sp. M26]